MFRVSGAGRHQITIDFLGCKTCSKCYRLESRMLENVLECSGGSRMGAGPGTASGGARGAPRGGTPSRSPARCPRSPLSLRPTNRVIYLSIFLSIYLSIYPSIYLSIHPYLSINLYLYISIYLSTPSRSPARCQRSPSLLRPREICIELMRSDRTQREGSQGRIDGA